MNARLRDTATLAGRLGVPAALRLARTLRRRPGRAIILMYHSIAEHDDYLGLAVRPRLFEAQLALLKRRAEVVPLRRLVERLRDPAPLTGDLAAITFDDGYRDNLEVALPILTQHGCSATVFVTTAFVDATHLPINIRLRHLFEAAWGRKVAATDWRSLRDEADRAFRTALAASGDLVQVKELTGHLKRLPADDLEQRLGELERLSRPSQPAPSQMLDWHGVRSLSDAGMEIASHTVTHPILSRVAAATAEYELRESKARLEAALALPVVGFAYPNGQGDDYNADHAATARRLGYEYACSAVRGINRPGSDPFQLRRIGIGNDEPPLFDLKLALGGPTQPCAA